MSTLTTHEIGRAVEYLALASILPGSDREVIGLAIRGLGELLILRQSQQDTFEILTSFRDEIMSLRDRGKEMTADNVIQRIDQIRGEMER
jgi:hypothetical protein